MNNSDEQGMGVLNLLVTFVFSVWTSIALEVVHGFLTLIFAVLYCVAVFYVQRYLKNRHKDENPSRKI